MASFPIKKSERHKMDSKGRTLLILQGAASLQSLMFDMFSPSKGLFSYPPQKLWILAYFSLDLSKNCIFSPWHYMLRNELPGNFKKGVQLVWRRTFLIHALTEEDSSNDGPFDLVPLDNIPPFWRQVRSLPKDKRMFSSTAEKSENIPEFLLIVKESSHTEFCGYQSGISMFGIAFDFGAMMLFNQYKRLKPLWLKISSCKPVLEIQN